MKLEITFTLEVPDKYSIPIGEHSSTSNMYPVTQRMVREYISSAVLSWGGQYHYSDWRRYPKVISNFTIKKVKP